MTTGTGVESLVAALQAAGAKALAEIGAAASAAEIEEMRVRHLGKKSELSALFARMKEVPEDKRREFGEAINKVKGELAARLAARAEAAASGELEERLKAEGIDITLPGRRPPRGHIHPLSAILAEIEDIFSTLGFEVAGGPDLEEEFYNFEALNIPADHPARDMHDTFYLAGGGVLRTHTSPVQIREMRKRGAPIAIICPGSVYRCDSDATHSPMFQQVEGLLVDQGVTFSHLKGVLTAFIRRIMGPNVQYRFRPSYFPFTEPSAEMDILWKTADGRETWLEVLGSGMVHPKVLEAGGCDPEKVTGFAFGLGVERFAMLKHGIPNIRLFYENDLRFLRQF